MALDRFDQWKTCNTMNIKRNNGTLTCLFVVYAVLYWNFREISGLMTFFFFLIKALHGGRV
jgi:hypothetical protein